MQATEHATLQRDQAFVREKAISDEVKRLQERLSRNAGKASQKWIFGPFPYNQLSFLNHCFVLLQIDEHMVKLLAKKAAITADELNATKLKMDLLEKNNSELRAASLQTLEEINRLRKTERPR